MREKSLVFLAHGLCPSARASCWLLLKYAHAVMSRYECEGSTNICHETRWIL